MPRSGSSVVLITQSSRNVISFCVSQHELTRRQRRAEPGVEDDLLEPIGVVSRLAIISAVGDGMRIQRDLSAKLLAALARANINIVVSPGDPL
ncbi:MAG: Bifunctional aspartokinase/homoserine dehydrogenase 1 [Sodalis sp.]|nr:MAG: Bifunctional aspartokinase/homoserine dehydrogenase 1 [Sodalis sp.]